MFKALESLIASRWVNSSSRPSWLDIETVCHARSCWSRSPTASRSRSRVQGWGWDNRGVVQTVSRVINSNIYYISNSDPESSSPLAFAVRRVALLDPYFDLCRSSSNSSPEPPSREFLSSTGTAVGKIAPHKTSTASSSAKTCKLRWWITITRLTLQTTFAIASPSHYLILHFAIAIDDQHRLP